MKKQKVEYFLPEIYCPIKFMIENILILARLKYQN